MATFNQISKAVGVNTVLDVQQGDNFLSKHGAEFYDSNLPASLADMPMNKWGINEKDMTAFCLFSALGAKVQWVEMVDIDFNDDLGYKCLVFEGDTFRKIKLL